MKAEDIARMRRQIEEEQETLRETQEKVRHLLKDIIRKESSAANLDSSQQMQVSLSKASWIGSLFKNDDYDPFFKCTERRERLAAERRAEYNAFLERKELQQKRRKTPEEQRSITPKSVLESVDYEKVLARMKEEESRFRNLNRAEPNVEKHVAKSPVATPRSVESPPEQNTPRLPVEVSNSPPKDFPRKPFLRTGGGGDPVKDSYGNLITARGFRGMPAGVMGFPSFTQESPPLHRNTYREELQRQIEEKRRLEALEKQKALEREEQMAQRIEQQQRQMQIEYQKELAKNNRRNEQVQQERLRKLEEFQRQDAVFRNQRPKETLVPPSSAPGPESERSVSPPVPAVRSKVILERTVSPVMTNTKVLNEVKPENVFSSLAEIRRSLMKDQHNSKRDFKDAYEVSNRRTVPHVLDEDEIKFE